MERHKSLQVLTGLIPFLLKRLLQRTENTFVWHLAPMVLAITGTGEEEQAAEPQIQDQALRNRQRHLMIAHSKKWG